MTELEPRPRTQTEKFIALQVAPRLGAGEVIVHSGYLAGDIQASGTVGVIVGAIGMRACLVALTQTRAFFLWNLPGRVGVFGPLLECSRVEIAERSQISGKVLRSGLLARSLYLSVNGDVVAFQHKRKVKSLPDQAALIDALCANPME